MCLFCDCLLIDDHSNLPSIFIFSFHHSSSLGTGSSNGNFSSLPPYPTANVQSYQQQASYPASANPFLDDDDNVDSLSSPHQSPVSTGYSSHESSAGVPVRALYDYEAQEQDELSFKQGKKSIELNLCVY
jgi:hypothetical protein